MFYAERPKGFTFEPDVKSDSEQEEKQHEQTGYFHCWIQEERKSAQSGLFREETVALVEDERSGKMFRVDYDLIRFVTD